MLFWYTGVPLENQFFFSPNLCAFSKADIFPKFNKPHIAQELTTMGPPPTSQASTYAEESEELKSYLLKVGCEHFGFSYII